MIIPQIGLKKFDGCAGQKSKKKICLNRPYDDAYLSQITFYFTDIVRVLVVQQHASQIVEHPVHVDQILHGFHKNVQHSAVVLAHLIRGLDVFVFFRLAVFPAATANAIGTILIKTIGMSIREKSIFIFSVVQLSL